MNNNILGTIHSGNGLTHFNQITKTLEIPSLNNKVFKVHERVIGPIIEAVAKETCSEAVEEERMLKINHVDELEKFL